MQRRWIINESCSCGASKAHKRKVSAAKTDTLRNSLLRHRSGQLFAESLDHQSKPDLNLVQDRP